jgi:hypothetical protein
MLLPASLLMRGCCMLCGVWFLCEFLVNNFFTVPLNSFGVQTVAWLLQACMLWLRKHDVHHTNTLHLYNQLYRLQQYARTIKVMFLNV